MKRPSIPQNLVYKKFYVHEKNLFTRNGRRGFIKNLLLEKRNKNMETKQPQIKSRLNYCLLRMNTFLASVQQILQLQRLQFHLPFFQ